KDDTTHSRRVVFSYLNNKESVKALFNEVSEKTSARPGGYTRIIKLGNRLGDNSDMCIIELVDYNENLLKDTAPAKPKTRRSRRGGSTKAKSEETKETTPVKEEKEETEVKAAKEAEEPKSEEKKEEESEAPKKEEPK